MTISVTITNDGALDYQGPATDAGPLVVSVVRMGNQSLADSKYLLQAGESVTVQVHTGQFVMVDETDRSEG